MEPGSASRPRSWSSYDRARRCRNKTNRSSVVDSRRHDPADGAPGRTVDAAGVDVPPPTSAAAAAVSAAVASALGAAAAAGSNSGTTDRRPRRGIGALSVPAADGVATTLRFQWVRPHPSDAFVLAAATAAAEAEADADANESGDGGDCKDQRGELRVPRRFWWGHDRPSPSAELSGMVYYPGKNKKRRRVAGTGEKASGNGDDRRGSKGETDGAEGPGRGSSDGDAHRGRRERAVGNGNGGDCVAGDIRVDASDLCFDPPLLTEWLPGVETSCSYDVGDTDDSSSSSGGEEGMNEESGDGVFSAERGEDDDGDGDSSCSSAVMELLGETMVAYRSSEGAASEDDIRRERRLKVLLSPLARLSPQELSSVLPSHLLLATVSDCRRKRNPDRDGEQHAAGASESSRRMIDRLTLALVALCSLAGACPSGGSSMGRHILRVLSPVALDPSSYRCSPIGPASSRRGGGGDAEQPVVALTRENEGLVRRLAGLLVSNGALGTLSRSELRALLSSMEEEEDDCLGSELMDELKCCVSEAFLA